MSYTCKMKLKVIQQNVCGREMYERNWSIQDYKELIKELKDKDPDIIFLTEFYYQQMYDVTQKILGEYELIGPISLSEYDANRKDLYATCVLAIKRTKVYKDKQIKLENMLEYRYICVDLSVEKNKTIKMLLMYIPQTYNAPKYRIEQKRKMIHSASIYAENNSNTLLFVGGDMNSDIDGKTTACIDEFEKLYNKMQDTDCKKEATWKGKRLDYALVNGIMGNSASTTPIKNRSDHKGLQTILELN